MHATGLLSEAAAVRLDCVYNEAKSEAAAVRFRRACNEVTTRGGGCGGQGMRILDYACDAAMDQGSEEPLNVWAAIEVGGCRVLVQRLPEPPATFRSLKHTCLVRVACRAQRNVRMLQAAVPGLRASATGECTVAGCTVVVVTARQAAAPRRSVSGGTEATRASARSMKHSAQLGCSGTNLVFIARHASSTIGTGQIMYNTTINLANCSRSHLLEHPMCVVRTHGNETNG